MTSEYQANSSDSFLVPRFSIIFASIILFLNSVILTLHMLRSFLGPYYVNGLCLEKIIYFICLLMETSIQKDAK